MDRQKPSVRCCTGGGPGELEAPLHGLFFLTVLGSGSQWSCFRDCLAVGQSGKDVGSGDKQPSFTSLSLGFLISEMGLWKDPILRDMTVTRVYKPRGHGQLLLLLSEEAISVLVPEDVAWG